MLTVNRYLLRNTDKIKNEECKLLMTTLINLDVSFFR